MKDDYLSLILLIKSILKNDNISFDNLNLDNIYKLSKEHMISSLILDSIEKLNIQIDEKLYNIWNDSREKEMIKDIMQQEETNLIKELLNENNIDYMLLKGSVVKNIYPETYQRTMSDVDVLVKNDNRKKIRTLLNNIGYDTIEFDMGNEDVYFKEPLYNIEIHGSLLSVYHNSYNYYNDTWNKLINVDNHEYKFKNEDFYIYMIIHFAKHYLEQEGAGVRNIIDIYLYNKKYKMDNKYIKNELKKVNLVEFHSDILELIDVWFNDKKITDKIINMSNYIISSGVYGSIENKYINLQKKYNNKLEHLLKRVFQPLEIMKLRYKILRKMPVLLPIVWIIHFFRTIFINPKKMLMELKRL